MQAEDMVSLVKVDFVKEYVNSSTCTNCCMFLALVDVWNLTTKFMK